MWVYVINTDTRGLWKKRSRRDPCETRRHSQVISKFYQHSKTTSKHAMSAVNSQNLSTALTIISTNIKGVLQLLKDSYTRVSIVTACATKNPS